MAKQASLPVSAPVSFGGMAARPPLTYPGMRIGLLGGSFNPAHNGHRNISLTALKTLQLDQVWWLVSPGNPLKVERPGHDTASLAERIKSAQACSNHPRIKVTSFEAQLGSSYTIGTLQFLLKRMPDVNFVWLMGADNLATFHQWQHWQRIAQAMPIAIFERPGYRLAAARSKAAARFAANRVVTTPLTNLPNAKPPAWSLITLPLSPQSSTDLREKRARAEK